MSTALSVPAVPRGATAAQRRQFAADGFFVTEPLVPAGRLAALQAAIEERWQAAIHEAERTDPARAEIVRTRAFLAHTHEYGRLFGEFLRDAVWVEFCRQLVGPDADLVWSQAIVKPGRIGRSLAWHQDARYAVTDPLDPGFTALIAVTPMTVANGTVWALPGRHREGLLPHVWRADREEWEGQYDVAAKVPIELRAGQALVFGRLVPHWSGPNESDAVRISYQIGYGPPGWKLAATGAPFGDAVPVLRGGRVVGG